MIVCEREKWLYMFEPHTASRATRLALEALPYCKHVPPHHRRPGLEKYRHYTKFCTVRNPFDTVVTKYYHGADYNHMIFQIFVRRNVNQPKCAPGMGLWKLADYHLRFEDLEHQLKITFGALGEIKLKHERHHKSSRRGKKPWHTYYNEHLYELLEGQKEFDEYLWRFNYGRHEGHSF